MASDSKIFSTILVLNWRSGHFKVLRPTTLNKNRKFRADEIPIDFSLKVNIPDPVKVKAHGEITLTEQKISEIVAEEL